MDYLVVFLLGILAGQWLAIWVLVQMLLASARRPQRRM